MQKKIYQNIESVLGYVEKNMLHQCNCMPLTGDPDNYHNIASNLQYLHNEKQYESEQKCNSRLVIC